MEMSAGGSQGRKRGMSESQEEDTASKKKKNEKEEDQNQKEDESDNSQAKQDGGAEKRMLADTAVLYNCVPAEAWLRITDKLKEPDVLSNLAIASPVFQKLLLERRVEFLFPQVWKALGWKFEVKADEVYSYNIDKLLPDRDKRRSILAQEDGEDPETPWFSKVLTLRGVCRSWCQGVDEFYEQLPEHDHYKMKLDREIPPEDRDPEDFKYYNDGNVVGSWSQNEDFSNNDDCKIIRKFMKHFDETHLGAGSNRTPIFGRNLVITFAKEHCGPHRHCRELLSLLSKYGHHVWYCRLDLIDDFHSRIVFYGKLKLLLKMLPNLKTLKIVYMRPPKAVKNSRWNVCSVRSEILALEENVSSYPLPRLDKLKFLSVENLPSTISNALIATNNHISMLEVKLDEVHPGSDSYNIRAVPLPNLKELSMKFLVVEEYEQLYDPEVNWQLEKLYLDLDQCDFIRWSRVFSLVQTKWASTLTNVILMLPRTYTVEDENTIISDSCSFRLELPKVQRFKIVTGNVFSLDFALPMADTLKYLEVEVAAYKYRESPEDFAEVVEQRLRPLEQEQIVPFVGYFYRFQESDMWKTFPRLKRFTVEELPGHISNYCYTRAEWEKAKNKIDKEDNPSQDGASLTRFWLMRKFRDNFDLDL